MFQPMVTFEYRISTFLGVMGGLLFTLFTAAFGYIAWTNTAQANIFGTIWPVWGTSIMLWGVCAFFFMFIPLSIAIIIQSRKIPNRVILTDTHITAPFGALRKKIIKIAFADINQVQVVEFKGNRILELKSSTKRLTIPNSCIRPNAEFNRLADMVKERVEAAKAYS